jgi:sugar phosphate isomerase/epimerase
MNIAVSSWSFRNALRAGELKLSQVPAACAMLGFELVELNDVFLRPRGRTGRLLSAFGRGQVPERPPDFSPLNLGALEKGLRAANTPLICLTADNDFMPEQPQALEEQIRYVRAVIGASRYLECNMVRLWLTPSPAGAVEVAEPTVEAFRQVTETAAKAGVRLALEHRLGVPEEIEAIVSVIQQIRSYHLGACLNFGHLPSDAFQVGLTRLAPYSIHVHARSREFDQAGNETTIPYPDCLAALKSRGYKGLISIEYVGKGDPLDGIMATKALIERSW